MHDQSLNICALVPTYNRAELLKECLDSLCRQTFPLAQIIVIDDGSTDNTAAVVKTYGDRVTYLSQANRGKSSALNLGLKQCTSNFVWVCDDDDLAATNGLEILVNALRFNPDSDIVFGTYSRFIDENGMRRFLMPLPLLRAGEPDIKINILEKMITNQFAMLVRKSLYDKIGFFNEEFRRSQDYEMTVRLSRTAQMITVPDVIFFYRQHATNNAPNAAQATKVDVLGRWQAFDQKIIQTVKSSYQLEEFTPTFARKWDEIRRTRAALIERGCVFLSHTMITDAFDNFKHALQMGQSPLSREETRLMQGVTIRYGINVTLEMLVAGLLELKTTVQSNDTNNKRMAEALCQCLTRHYLGGNAPSSFKLENAKIVIGILRIICPSPLIIVRILVSLMAQRMQTLIKRMIWNAQVFSRRNKGSDYPT